MDNELKRLHQVYLGLGSNLGKREDTIDRAIALISEQIGIVERRSALYYSEPWGYESENGFVNAVVCVSTTLSPMCLLRATQRIERQLGKTEAHATQRMTTASDGNSHKTSTTFPQSSTLTPQPSTVYHDRPIDIDILLYDDRTIDLPQLKIPHPLMQERDFVMVPLGEVCPTYADPEPSR